MNRYFCSRLAIVSGVLGAMVLTVSPASAQSRMFHPTVFRTTTPTRITNFNSPHAAVPVQRARSVVIDPFLHTPVASLNSSGSVVAFNPFIRTNALITFPNAHSVHNPFGVPTGDFRGDFTTHRMTPPTRRELERAEMLRQMMYGGNGMGYGSGMMGYGGGGYGGGYGGGGGGSSSGSGYQPAAMMTATTPTESPAAVTVEWPIGLRVLPPTAETDRVRLQLLAALEALSNSPSAEQATALKVNAMQEIKTLRNRLDDVGYKLASGTVADARRFLDQVEASLKTVP